METVTLEIPIRKIPRLATAAILSGDDLGSWFVKGIDASPLSSSIPGDEVVADGRIVLENLDDVVARQKDTEPTVSDFFADIV